MTTKQLKTYEELKAKIVKHCPELNGNPCYECDLATIPELRHVLRAIGMSSQWADWKLCVSELGSRNVSDKHLTFWPHKMSERGKERPAIVYDLTKSLKDQPPETLEWLNSVISA